MTFNLFGREIYIRKEIAVVVVVLVVAALGTIGFLASRNSGQVVIGTQEPGTGGRTETAAPTLAAGARATPGEAAKPLDEIRVYVVGCVNNPGIVTLKKGQLIDDAIKGAGGATADADLSNINLVYRLKDNVMLRIRSVKEGAGASGAPKEQPVSQSGEAGAGIEVISDSGGAVVSDTDSGEVKDSGANSPVNINTASAAELDALPGIGEQTAGDIIAYREKNGPFTSINDIMKVPGIKESKFSKIKDFITVD